MCYYGIRDPPTDNHMNITEMNIKSQSVELLGIGNRIGIIILRKIEVGMRKLSYLRLKSIMRYVLRAETIDVILAGYVAWQIK